ncbi:MAG: GntR family transcriptional regulator [Solirubrobacteraceae bacterium]|nr:GntR family transcriptional regulator [Patulibacter sp.]
MPADRDTARPAAETAYDEIRRRIVAGDYEQGSPLTEAGLSTDLGVSRTPVRAALTRLAADGLVEQKSNRRIVVAEWGDSDIEEIFGLRAVLESYGAGLAAATATTAQTNDLEVLCQKMDEALAAQEPGWLAEVTALNNEFHRSVLEATGNRRLINLVASIVEIPLTHRTIGAYSVRQLENSWSEHRSITEAFRLRDGEWAASIMRSHILTGRAITQHGHEHPTAYELDPLAEDPTPQGKQKGPRR